MNFESIEALHQYAVSLCQQIHPDDFDFLFISGSIVRGTATEYSDIDYTACVSDSFDHPRFKFFVAIVSGIPRICSIYFYKTSELLITQSEMDEEHFLWEKGMMQHDTVQFIAGKENLFNDCLAFYAAATFKKILSHKTIHKSTGKLLELLVKVRKYKDKNDLTQMIYYGMKIAEHARRIVFEANPPLQLQSESEMLHAIISMKNQPKNFGNLYKKVMRISSNNTTSERYFQHVFNLCENTLIFVHNSPHLHEQFTQDLLATNIFELLAHVQKSTMSLHVS